MIKLTGIIIKWFPEKKQGQIGYENLFFNLKLKNLINSFEDEIEIGKEVNFNVVEKKNGNEAKEVKVVKSTNVTKVESIESIPYYLPADSREWLNKEKGGENYWLMLNRFSRKVDEEKKYPELYYQWEKNNRTKPLKLIYLKKFIQPIKEKNEEIFNEFKFKHSLNFKTISKLAIGIGGQSPYNNIALITLHHIYGIPYIPGSAIKGMLRHYIENEILGKAIKEIEKSVFWELFGADDKETENGQKGKLIFLDSYPIEKPDLVFDIITPHYSAYYSSVGNEKPPTDWMNPVPTYFPAILPVNFIIQIGSFSAIDEETGKVLEKVLKEALENYGIGAKTSIGYGLREPEE